MDEDNVPHQADNPTAYRWVVIVSLTSLGATQLTIIFVLGLLLPDISDDLDLSPSEQGWLGSSVLLANLFLAIPLSILLSRYRPWRIVALLSLGAGLFGLMQGWSPALAVLLIGRVGTGICFTANQSPRALLIQQWIPHHRLAFANGVWFGGVDLGMGAAFFVTPLIVEWLGGWQETFYFWGGAALLASVVWTIWGKERTTEEYQQRIESQERTPITAFLKYPQLWLLGLGMAGSQVGYTAFEVFWPTLAENELDFSASLVGIVLGVMAMAAGPANLLVNAVPTLARKQLLVLATCGVVNAVAYVGLIYSESSVLTLMLAIIEGIFRAYFPVLFVMVYQMPDIKPREMGVGLGFISTCIWIGSALGPLIVGFLQEETGDLRLGLLVTSMTPLILLISAGLLQVRQWSSIGRGSRTTSL